MYAVKINHLSIHLYITDNKMSLVTTICVNLNVKLVLVYAHSNCLILNFI